MLGADGMPSQTPRKDPKAATFLLNEIAAIQAAHELGIM